MDTLSHGLYGGIAFGRKSKISYWKAFFFGVMPDIFSFGIFTAGAVLGLVSGPDWSGGPPHPSEIPTYIHYLYNVTHSLVVAGTVFGIVWFMRKEPLMELLAWPLHIFIDMPTHSSAFFPTPFLWPVSDFTINGISWGTPWILIPNAVLLIALYTAWYIRSRKKRDVD